MPSASPSVLDRARPQDVVAEPFPHLVLRQALEPLLYRHLAGALPAIEAFGGEPGASNVRRNLMAHQVLADRSVDPLWREFVRVHTSLGFFHRFLGLFGEALRASDPGIEERLGPLDGLRTGLRKVDRHPEADVLLDAMVAVNTPVRGAPSSVRGPHLDLPDKLYSGLFYMRHPEDRSTGGDLELYRYRDGSPAGFSGWEVAPERVEPVVTVPYEANVLVLFVNSAHALHGVTARSVTEVPRRFACLIAQVDHPRFAPGGGRYEPAAAEAPS